MPCHSYDRCTMYSTPTTQISALTISCCYCWLYPYRITFKDLVTIEFHLHLPSRTWELHQPNSRCFVSVTVFQVELSIRPCSLYFNSNYKAPHVIITNNICNQWQFRNRVFMDMDWNNLVFMNDLLHVNYEKVGSLMNFLGFFHALKKNAAGLLP